MLGHQGAKQSGSLSRSLSDCFTLNRPRAEMLSAGWILSPAGQRAAKPVTNTSCPGSGRPAPVLRESEQVSSVGLPVRCHRSLQRAKPAPGDKEVTWLLTIEGTRLHFQIHHGHPFAALASGPLPTTKPGGR